MLCWKSVSIRVKKTEFTGRKCILSEVGLEIFYYLNNETWFIHRQSHTLLELSKMRLANHPHWHFYLLTKTTTKCGTVKPIVYLPKRFYRQFLVILIVLQSIQDKMNSSFLRQVLKLDIIIEFCLNSLFLISLVAERNTMVSFLSTGRIQCEVLTTLPILSSWIKKFPGQQSKIWVDNSVEKLFR